MKRSLLLSKELGSSGEGILAFREGRGTLDRPQPLRDPVRKEVRSREQFFQLLWRIRSQAQGKDREERWVE